MKEKINSLFNKNRLKEIETFKRFVLTILFIKYLKTIKSLILFYHNNQIKYLNLA